MSEAARSLPRQRSPHARLTLDGEQLVVVFGADELYLFDELRPDEARALHEAWQRDALDALADGAPRDSPLARALADLEGTGAIERRHARDVAVPLRVGIAFAGEPDAALADQLTRLIVSDKMLRSDSDADLTLFVRTTAALVEAAALSPPRAHLLVDVGFAHTISIGPLVWPGETACLSCFAGRVRQAWGDPAPPPSPRALASRELVAALALVELRRFRELGDCPDLVARAVSLDLATLASRADRVHRLPWCPRCFPSTIEDTSYGAGSFALPWPAVTAKG